MRVAIVNHSDALGGAAKASYRLHKALLDTEVESRMFVMNKVTNDSTVLAPKNYKFRRGLRSYLDSLPLRLLNNPNSPFSLNWLPISPIFKMLNEFNPDVVHLNWINGGFISIKDFKKIDPPIVWTLHDNWAFTGGCHIMNDCEKYKTECKKCPKLDSFRDNDLSRLFFHLKEKTYQKISNLTIVGPSNWITKRAKESYLLSEFDVLRIPNLIDTNLFKPLDKNYSREVFSLPKNKNLVLFGALNATKDSNKGYEELLAAIEELNNDKIELVVFGNTTGKKSEEIAGYKTHYLGQLVDEVSLSTLYSAADVMVVPSKQENLSNTILESLACGTPVIAFDIGGNSDMIEHKENGYLASPFSINELSAGIEWILQNSSQKCLRTKARQKITDEFKIKSVIPKWLKLYKDII